MGHVNEDDPYSPRFAFIQFSADLDMLKELHNRLGTDDFLSLLEKTTPYLDDESIEYIFSVQQKKSGRRKLNG